MKRALRLAIIPIALAGMILTFSCSDSEHRIPFGYARAVINLNLPPETPDAQAGLIEKIRRFLVPDAIAQTAPAAFSSITVRVTGPDIALIEKSFAPYATISLGVPAGALRIFDVTAYVAPGDPSAALSFRGTASANCPAGATVSVPVVMGLNETKILLPDPGASGFENYRIIQMDDMTGAGYVVRAGADMEYPLNFRAWDIDFDARGRIYIAVNEWSALTNFQPKIIRLDSITSMSFETIVSYDETGFGTIAIDRARNLVYFARDNELFRCNTDGSNLTGPVTTAHGIATIIGLALGGGGKLFILGRDGVQAPGVYAYDFDAMSVSSPYTSSEFIVGSTGPEDIMVRGSSVYVANPEGADGYKIIELTTGLEFVAAYGSQNIEFPDTATGRFYGPRRFVAIRNDELIIIDDLYQGGYYDKLVSMTGMTGANWKTFPDTGDGQAYFRFFYSS